MIIDFLFFGFRAPPPTPNFFFFLNLDLYREADEHEMKSTSPPHEFIFIILSSNRGDGDERPT